MNIAVLGTGKVGSALGQHLSTAGHTVVYGSRSPQDHPGSLSQADAVAGAEVIITALPGTEVVSTLEKIGEDVLGDRIVLDPSAAFTAERHLAYPNDSVAGQLQARFPRLRVVKALNTMNYLIMVQPHESLDQATVFLSGDDAAAKTAVTALLADLGWRPDDVVDLGDVRTAIGTEHLAPLFFATVMKLGTPKFNFALSR